MKPYDPHDIVTPDAFSVAPELLGIRLAHPGRRLLAIAIDAAFVGLIAQTSLVVLIGLVCALLLWRALVPGTSPSLPRRAARLALRITIAIFSFVLVLKLWAVVRPERAGAESDRNAAAASAAAPAAPVAPAVTDSLLAAVTARGSDSLGAADSGAAAALRTGITELAERNATLERRVAELEAESRPVHAFFAEITDELGLGLGWFGFYFTVLTVLLRGQTPGKRLLGIRVIRLDNTPIGWWISFERFGGYAASFFSGTLGFAQILWDRNRQALHDKATGTVVIRVVRGEAVRSPFAPAVAARGTPVR